jgi:hypothetical protein
VTAGDSAGAGGTMGFCCGAVQPATHAQHNQASSHRDERRIFTLPCLVSVASLLL